MRIAVCDDDKKIRDDLRQAVYAYAGLRRLSLLIDEFTDGEMLLKSNTFYDIIFLDYQMDGLDGLAVARELRELKCVSTIIFLTNYPQFVYEAFEVSTFRFLKKPLSNERLHKALDDYFKPFLDQHSILVKVDREARSIRIMDIIYISADNKSCTFHLKDEALPIARTMAYIERLIVGNQLCRINKSFIVNMNYVNRFDYTYVYISNQEQLPIGRKYLISFRDKYMKFSKCSPI